MTLLSNSWIGQHTTSQLEGHSEGLYKMQGFYRKKGEERELLTKEKGLFWDQDVIFPEEGNGKGFYHADYLLLLFSERDGEGPLWQNVTGAWQENSRLVD